VEAIGRWNTVAHFGNLDATITQNGGILVPAMYKQCPDFRVAYETGINKNQEQPGDGDVALQRKSV